VHESAIAKRVLAVVLDRATAGRASRVVAVRGRVAESERLSNESLAFHFAAHALGTIAEGAALTLEISPVSVHCDGCGTTYMPEHHMRICPRCNCSEGRLTGEEGVWIEGVDVQ
jgi:hydrogenase nickel incorporation protein HypA/HybF